MDLSEVKQLTELDVASRLLLQAAALIEKQGLWCGGVDGGGQCVLTALIAAEGRTTRLGDRGEEAFGRFAAAIGVVRQNPEKVYMWNDERSKDEVVAKLRAVALESSLS